jgi:hypothetical protein
MGKWKITYYPYKIFWTVDGNRIVCHGVNITISTSDIKTSKVKCLDLILHLSG